MATWCVYHLIHVRTPWQYIPRLVITDVPDQHSQQDASIAQRMGIARWVGSL